MEILQDINFNISTGEFVCFYGPSGVGKTTILHLIAGLINPDCGSVEVSGKKFGYVFQEPRLLPWCNVMENIEISLYAIMPDSPKKRLEIIKTLLKKVELEPFSQYYPSQLSGGMRQRVSLARAFAVEPEILLLDEPFSSLDFRLKCSLSNYLDDLLSWKPCATILVSHDLEEAVRLADKILLVNGRPCQIIHQTPIDRPRGQRDEEYVMYKVNQIQSLLNKETNK